ncbi:MAG: tRNA (guanosine(37)-N1)-methyltransferase TrmD [Acidiferrobacteraceae bacterium]
MDIDVVTLFPDMLSAITDFGVTSRAVRNGLVRISTWNPRDYTEDRHRTVDDRPYGGGPGMVMMPGPLSLAIRAARAARPSGVPVIYLSPQGKRVHHDMIVQLARGPGAILVAGRYEGVDERVLESDVDEEWSIGDYVLSGGELPAMVLIDALARQIPGVLGDEDSAKEDSFVEGLLDCPHYTRPEVFEGTQVPQVLLSGDHAAIRRWRLKQSLGRTWERRPDLLQEGSLTDEQQELLREYRRERGEKDV